MERKRKTALFIGRFQPFHKGHLLALKWIAQKCGRVIVAIGSAQKGFEPENPFTAKERKEMIRKQLKASGLHRICEIVEVTDINDDRRWVAHVDKHVPGYDEVYSNNPLVMRLMRKAGKKVLPIPFFKKSEYNATKIRTRMRKGEGWRSRVPREIKRSLEKMRAEERVKRL